MATVKLALNDLIANLQQVPPADLLGVTLLEQYEAAPGEWVPRSVPRDQVVKATLQLVEYGSKCRQLANNIAKLQATPIEKSVAEYGL